MTREQIEALFAEYAREPSITAEQDDVLRLARTALDALAEVERLRAEVRMSSFMGEGYVFVEGRALRAEAEVERLREENGRLRAASDYDAKVAQMKKDFPHGI